jgi:protein-S-isoprenylcysteine O-methyltransferase Ste14
MKFSKRYADTVAKLRVPSGFLLAVSFFVLARPTPESLATGLPFSMLGLLLRAAAAGHLAKNQQLATSGPYSYIRNPLYAGTLLVAAGLVIAALRWELAVIYAAVFWLVYLPVIQLEEEHLEKLFPQYADYRRQVPLLIPARRSLAPDPNRFRWDLYVRNEEWKALVAWLIAAAWLIWLAARQA